MDNFGEGNNFDGGFGDEEIGTAGGGDKPGVLEGGEIELLENWTGVLEEIWSFVQGFYDEAGVDGLRKTFQDKLGGCVGRIELGVRDEDWGWFGFRFDY